MSIVDSIKNVITSNKTDNSNRLTDKQKKAVSNIDKGSYSRLSDSQKKSLSNVQTKSNTNYTVTKESSKKNYEYYKTHYSNNRTLTKEQVASNYEWYKNYKKEQEAKQNELKSTTESNKYSRSKVDRVLGLLGYNGITQGIYYLTDDDDSTTFTQGLKEGFKYMNPFNDDVSNRKYFSDVLKDNVDAFEDDPDTKADNVGRFIVGLAGDILLDPLSYINGVGAASKILKGTGSTAEAVKSIKNAQHVSDVAKRFETAKSGINTTSKISKLKDVTLEDARKIILQTDPLSKQLTSEEVDTKAINLLNSYASKVRGFRDLDEGKGLSFGLDNLVPSINNGKTASKKVSGVDKMTYTFKNATSDKLRSLGDKTVAPYVNSAINKVRSTKLAEKVSSYNKLLNVANSEGDLRALMEFATKKSVHGVTPSIADESIRHAGVSSEIQDNVDLGNIDEIGFIRHFENGDFKQANSYNYFMQNIDIKELEQAKDYLEDMRNIRIANSTSDEVIENAEQMYKEGYETITNLENLKNQYNDAQKQYYFQSSNKKLEDFTSKNYKYISTLDKEGVRTIPKEFDGLNTDNSVSSSIFKGYSDSVKQSDYVYEKYFDDIQSELNIHSSYITDYFSNLDDVTQQLVVDLYKSVDDVVTSNGIPYSDILYFNGVKSYYNPNVVDNNDFLYSIRQSASSKLKTQFGNEDNEFYKKVFQSYPLDEQKKFISNYHQSFIDAFAESLSNAIKNVSGDFNITDLSSLSAEERNSINSLIKESLINLRSGVANSDLLPDSIENYFEYFWKNVDYFHSDFFSDGNKVYNLVDNNSVFKISPESSKKNLLGNIKPSSVSGSKYFDELDSVTKFIKTNQGEIDSAIKAYSKEISDVDKMMSDIVSKDVKTYDDKIVNIASYYDTFTDVAKELSKDEVQMKIYDIFSSEMDEIAYRELSAGYLTPSQVETLSGKYVPHIISDEAKPYIEVYKAFQLLTGQNPSKHVWHLSEDALNDLKKILHSDESGGFNPEVFGNRTVYNHTRTWKTIDECAQQTRINAINHVKNANGISFKEAETLIDDSIDPETWYSLYETNLANIFLKRSVDSDKLILDDAVSNFVHFNLCTRYRPDEGATSDKVVATYRDIYNELYSKFTKGIYDVREGKISIFEFPYKTFDEYKSAFLKEFGVDEKLFTANVSHFEVNDDMNNVFKKYTDKDLVRYNMSNSVFGLVNRYTKEQMQTFQSKFTSLYDTLLSKWKIFQTVYTPGFHIQNSISNAFQSFIGAGINALNPNRLRKAFNIIKNPDTKQTVTLNGTKYTYKEVSDIVQYYKVIDNTFFNEDILEKAPSFFLTKIGSKVGSGIEGLQRVNLFMTFVDNGYSFEDAAKGVDKFLFDYGDLTDTEKLVFRRIIPFYSFMRKNLPMELEQLIEQPTIFTGLNKTFAELSQSGDEEYISENEKQDWNKNYIQLPLTTEDGKSIGISNVLPYTQFDRILNLKKLAGQSSPFIKTPAELLSGKQLYTGQDIGSAGEYILNQLGYFGNLFDANLNKEDEIKNLYILGQTLGVPINNVSKTYDWYDTGFAKQKDDLINRILELR